MKWDRIIISVALMLVAAQPAFAKWIGRGEVTGEVIQSRSANNGAIFRLIISSQKIEQGPELGSPNTFSFDGPVWMEITTGDIVKLRVNSSDYYGIRVEQIEFIENKPGTIKQTYSTWWIVILFAAVAATVVFLLRRRKREG